MGKRQAGVRTIKKNPMRTGTKKETQLLDNKRVSLSCESLGESTFC